MATPSPSPFVDETPRHEMQKGSVRAQLAGWLGYAAVASVLISAYFSASNLWRSSVPLAPYTYYGLYVGPVFGFLAWVLGKEEMNDIAAGNAPPAGLRQAKFGRRLGSMAGWIVLGVGVIALIIGLIILSELGGGDNEL